MWFRSHVAEVHPVMYYGNTYVEKGVKWGSNSLPYLKCWRVKLSLYSNTVLTGQGQTTLGEGVVSALWPFFLAGWWINCKQHCLSFLQQNKPNHLTHRAQDNFIQFRHHTSLWALTGLRVGFIGDSYDDLCFLMDNISHMRLLSI